MEKETLNLSSWLKLYTSEFKRINWPSRKDIIKETISVIVISLIFGAIVIGYDYIIRFVYNLLLNLIG